MKIEWSKFKTEMLVGRKLRIVNILGDIISENPTKEESDQLRYYPGRSCYEIKNLLKEDMKVYLLEIIRYFYYREGRIPLMVDFNNNPKYPSCTAYQRVFGSWNNAIREAGLQPRQKGGGIFYSDEELLKTLIQFFEEKGRLPVEEDFVNNPKYPSHQTYYRRFGSWGNALKILGLDLDSMIRYGIVENSNQKGRLGELFVLESFDQIGAIDLSGKNRTRHSSDGKCPQGYDYDVKTSGLKMNYWRFYHVDIQYEVEYFYLLAFSTNYDRVMYAWRIPTWEFIKNIEKSYIDIGLSDRYEYNISNMKKYEISEQIEDVYKKWKNSIKKCTKEEIMEDARSKIKIHVEAEQGEKQIQRLEKGSNSNFDRIEGVTLK